MEAIETFAEIFAESFGACLRIQRINAEKCLVWADVCLSTFDPWVDKW